MKYLNEIENELWVAADKIKELGEEVKNNGEFLASDFINLVKILSGSIENLKELTQYVQVIQNAQHVQSSKITAICDGFRTMNEYLHY